MKPVRFLIKLFLVCLCLASPVSADTKLNLHFFTADN